MPIYRSSFMEKPSICVADQCVQLAPKIAFWQHHPVADQALVPFLDATLRFHDEVGGDLIKLMPANTYQTASLGLKSDWVGDRLGRRRILSRLISDANEWDELDTEFLGEQETIHVSAAQNLRRYFPKGGPLPILATVFSPMTQAIQLAGPDTLCRQATENPYLLAEGIRRLSERTQRLIAAYEQAGVDGIFYVVQHYSPEYAVLNRHPGLTIQTDERMMMSTQAKRNIIHFHGQVGADDLPQLPPGWVGHFEWDTSHLPKVMPAEVAIGLPIDTLLTPQSPAQCKAEIRHAIAACDSVISMVSPSCVLPLDFPLSTSRMWVDALRHW